MDEWIDVVSPGLVESINECVWCHQAVRVDQDLRTAPTQTQGLSGHSVPPIVNGFAIQARRGRGSIKSGRTNRVRCFPVR